MHTYIYMCVCIYIYIKNYSSHNTPRSLRMVQTAVRLVGSQVKVLLGNQSSALCGNQITEFPEENKLLHELTAKRNERIDDNNSMSS